MNEKLISDNNAPPHFLMLRADAAPVRHSAAAQSFSFAPAAAPLFPQCGPVLRGSLPENSSPFNFFVIVE
jgi:hypothetical protein